MAKSKSERFKKLNFFGLSDETLSSISSSCFGNAGIQPVWEPPPDFYRAKFKQLKKWQRMPYPQKKAFLHRDKDRSPKKRQRRALVEQQSPNIPVVLFSSEFDTGEKVLYQTQDYSGTATVFSRVGVLDYMVTIGQRQILANESELSHYVDPRKEKIMRLLDEMNDDGLLEVERFILARQNQARPCQGMTIDSVCEGKSQIIAEKMRKGFLRIVSDSIHRMGTAVSHDFDWPVDSSKIHGCVDVPDGSSPRLLLRLKDGVGNKGLPGDRYGFVSSSCLKNIHSGDRFCSGCRTQLTFIKKKCLKLSEWEDGVPRDKLNVLKLSTVQSPTNLRNNTMERTVVHRNERKQDHRKLLRMEIKLKEAEERSVSPELLKQFGYSHISEMFRDKDVKKLWDEELQKESMETKELANALFEEHSIQAETARRSGKKQCRYSEAFFQYVIQLKIKLGNGRYDFTARALGLPSLSQVNRKMRSRASSASACANGGILYDSLENMQRSFCAVYGNHLPMEAPVRSVSLAWDSTSILAGLEYNSSTKEVVGVAYDFEQGRNLFFSALSSDESEEEDESYNISLAKHFMVFLATTVDKNKDAITRTVARYPLKEVTSDFLIEAVDDVTEALFLRGFVVRLVAYDGASENRSWKKWRATHSLGELVELGICPAPPTREQPNGGKPDSDRFWWNGKIAYRHPSFTEDCNVFILTDPDMPHVVKKVVNAMDNSSDSHSKRDLVCKGKKINLKMVEEAWRLDFKPGRLRTTRFTVDHFRKNPHNCMRFYFAAQVMSESAAMMIRDVFEDQPDKMDEYSKLLEFIQLIDRLVDVMNAKQKGCHGVDSPTHTDIFHLLKCVDFVEDWREDMELNGDQTKDNFLPMTLYEDFVGMCLSSYVIASQLCDSESAICIDFGRRGTDCCEHRFGNLKMKCSGRLTVGAANNGTYAADNMNANCFNLKRSSNTSGKKIDTSQFRAAAATVKPPNTT